MFWIREIAGWLFIMVGLYAGYRVTFIYLPNGKYIESIPTVMIGLAVFRGGIHMLKVAVAARLCQQAPKVELPKVAINKPVIVKGRSVIPGKR